MTFAEKEVVIRALRCYQDQQKRVANREMKRGESGKAAAANSEATKANAVMFEFAELLTIPCGQALI